MMLFHRRSPPPVLATVAALTLVTLALPSGQAQAQETPYTVTLQGAEQHDDLRALLQQVSSLFALRDQPPPSPIGLRRRAEADRERLRTALRSAGYYDGTIDVQVDTAPTPAGVVISVTAGPRYTLTSVQVAGLGGETVPGAPITAPDLGLELGQPARAPDVQSAQDAIPSLLAARGHAYARVVDRQVVVDHETRGMAVTYVVSPGPAVTIGAIAISGLEKVEETAVRRRLDLAPGQPYDPAALTRARTDVSDLGTFSSVRISLADQPLPDGTAPVTIELEERERRFVGFGVDFATEEGFGANAYWGHRNLLGGAERLRVSGQIAGVGRDSFGDVGDFDYRLGATYEEPDFLTRRQKLTIAAQAVAEQPDAFRREAIILSGAIERPLWTGFTGSLGATLEQSRVEEGEQTTTNTLFGIPAALSVERVDDLLNPTRGWRASAAFTPYWAAIGDSESFSITRIGGSTYWDLSSDGSLIAAGRVVLGGIVGVGGLLDIPADKRFYAGGGGSIRGYGYQEVGPIGIDGDPLGGRSLVEVSAELRWQVSDSIGIVPFIDGGNVFISEYPDFEEDLRWGAGLGLRYFTGIGPIRLDVAIPLNRRDRDASWQLYISIGQAF